MKTLKSILTVLFFTFLISLNYTSAAAGGLPNVKKAVNSNLPHAITRGIERGIFPDKATASNALKSLSRRISSKGFPPGSFVDPSHRDRVLVPVGKGGLASYQVGSNGTAKLKTVLIKK